MSNIKDSTHSAWQTVQGGSLLPLADLRATEDMLSDRKARMLLDVGLDLTSIALYAFAKETPGVSFDIAVPRKSAFTVTMCRKVTAAGFVANNVHECTSAGSAILELPDVLTDKSYDFVRILRADETREMRHLRQIVLVILGLLADEAVILISQETGSCRRIFHLKGGF